MTRDRIERLRLLVGVHSNEPIPSRDVAMHLRCDSHRSIHRRLTLCSGQIRDNRFYTGSRLFRSFPV